MAERRNKRAHVDDEREWSGSKQPRPPLRLLDQLPEDLLELVWACLSTHDLVTGCGSASLYLYRQVCMSTQWWTRQVELKFGDEWRLECLAQSSVSVRDLVLENLRHTDESFSRVLHLSWLRSLQVMNCEHFGWQSMNLLVLNQRLGRLSLCNCPHVDDAAVMRLASLRVQELDLSYTGVTDLGLSALADLPLHSLKLRELSITGAGLAHLLACPLTVLDLSGCTNLRAADWAWLPDFPQLSTLHLSGCSDVTDAALAHLTPLPLRVLGLAGCGITDRGLALLERLPLQQLDLSNTAVSATGMRSVRQLSRLTKLLLRDCDHITNDALGHLAPLSLWQLDLGFTPINDDGLEHLVHMPLSHLDLRSTPISVDGLRTLASAPTLLRTLKWVALYDAVDDEHREDILAHFSQQLPSAVVMVGSDSEEDEEDDLQLDDDLDD